MKKEIIVKIIGQEFGSSDVAELNKILKGKAAPQIKFRITGKKIGHLGFTGLIKAIAPEGVKVFDVKKVSLFKFSDIEKIEKAKPKVPRPEAPKSESLKPATQKRAAEPKKVEDPVEKKGSFYEDDLKPEKFRKKASGKQGSSFIPKSRK
ncbi:hypothetical protein [Bdellovibrio svalbardensis]|uniref:Uncharacterized protein n=1 Tax=Bdellovibrio svalbardensis TaxID=2972972 RepID=A0ABT6DGJ4_9BACT|nr:hypothetical protein [Bdellovibrio svalbardensis]MDG0815978.1 hypothetical protein [Bdellovibrio svalbardensis]